MRPRGRIARERLAARANRPAYRDEEAAEPERDEWGMTRAEREAAAQRLREKKAALELAQYDSLPPELADMARPLRFAIVTQARGLGFNHHENIRIYVEAVEGSAIATAGALDDPLKVITRYGHGSGPWLLADMNARKLKMR